MAGGAAEGILVFSELRNQERRDSHAYRTRLGLEFDPEFLKKATVVKV
jgi:hypothetical protein